MTPRRIVATGTFDLLHPGHLFYLEESKKLGDELFVIVARDANVKHKPHPIIPEDQRLAMVAALKPVDHAMLGDQTDMFLPIEKIHPDVITIGFNQMFDAETLSRQLAARGLTPADRAHREISRGRSLQFPPCRPADYHKTGPRPPPFKRTRAGTLNPIH